MNIGYEDIELAIKVLNIDNQEFKNLNHLKEIELYLLEDGISK